MNTLLNCLYVGIGGFLGSILRYVIGLAPVTANGLPIKTLLINALGALAIGAISAWAQKSPGVNPQTLLLLKVGVCGGFTTFSTFALEAGTLLQDGRGLLALIYIILSVCLCVGAVFVGQFIVK